MKTLILYFSGTGNTAYVAKEMASLLQEMGEEIILHTMEEQALLQPDTFDRLILGCPKYYEYPVVRFLKYLKSNLPVNKESIPVLFFCTQASRTQTDYTGVKKLLVKKNYSLLITKSIPMANNLTIMKFFPLTGSKEVKENLDSLNHLLPQLLHDFLHSIPQKESVPFLMHAACQTSALVISALFAKFGVKYSASTDCVGCGLCAVKCPVKNITIQNKKPVFKKNCIFCMRCFNICPHHAILYNKKKHPQYRLVPESNPAHKDTGG